MSEFMAKQYIIDALNAENERLRKQCKELEQLKKQDEEAKNEPREVINITCEQIVFMFAKGDD